jgi:alpha-beta hydrolase superfamily lysophospholipase
MEKYKYIEDVLKDGFEQTMIFQPNDYEGKVVITLVRKQTKTPSSKAVLYVHGFNDYFFQNEMAEEFLAQGYNFYAVDLRKYGRSKLPNHKLNNMRDLVEYYSDLDLVLSILKEEGNQKILLSGHSTGGLLITLYAAERIGNELFDFLFCNSPFFDMNLPFFQKKFGIPILACLGRFFPDFTIPGGFSEFYGKSLCKNDFGEWDYNLTWKPHKAPVLNLGWINAIYQGHSKIASGIVIGKPILIMHSNTSVYPEKWSEALFDGDAILNVKDILEKAKLIKAPENKIIGIDGAMHDIILSKKTVRSKVYQIVFDWLGKF